MMNWPRDTELYLRIAVTLALLIAITFVLMGFIYKFFGIIIWIGAKFGVISVSMSEPVSLIAVVVIIGTIAIFEFRTAEKSLFQEFSTQPLKFDNFSGLSNTVERMAQQANIPIPSIVIINTEVPNVYTTGLSPQRTTIAVTTGLLKLLDDTELQAVVGHELAHVKNRDAAVMTIASLPLVIAMTINRWTDRQWARLSNGSSHGSDPVGGVLLGLPVVMCFTVAGVFWVVGYLLVRVLSRYRELAADRGAVALTGTPAALASALNKFDANVESLPDEDLRSVTEASNAFAIVPVDSDARDGPVRLGSEGERLPFLSQYTHPLREAVAPLLATHPSMERRLEQLQDLQAKYEN